jgi:hypothetical protein
MQGTKESWTRIGILTAVACLAAGISFGSILVFKPPGLVGWALLLMSFWLIGFIFSFAFPKQGRFVCIAILTGLCFLAFLVLSA